MAIRGAGQTLRILLVSASEHSRDEVGEALASKGFEHQLYWVSQPDLALIRAQDVVPDIVLVDDELAGANAVPLMEQLVARVPRAAVLALLGSDAVTKASQAMLAGVRGLVTKPVQADDLATTLKHVLTRNSKTGTDASESADGRVVVFCAPKGGTGRSTLAINTAVSLQMSNGKDVVLVDADYAAPALDVALNLHSERNISDLLPRLSHLDEELLSGVLVAHASGMQVLLAPSPSGESSPISLPQVQQILVLLKRMFSWVLIDLGLPMNETAFAFLDSADHIVMTVLPEMVSLRNARLMLDQLRAQGYPDSKIWLVVNRATMRGGIALRDIEERLRVQVKHSIPDDQPLATYSINLGVPLAIGYRKSAVALAVRELVRQLTTDLATGEEGERVAHGEAAPTADGSLDKMRALMARMRVPGVSRLTPASHDARSLHIAGGGMGRARKG